MAIFYLNTIPLFPPLSLSISLVWLTTIQELSVAFMLYLTLYNYCLNIGYINSLLFIILLFITYIIFLKKEFFSTPCKVKERKKIPAGSGVVPYISIINTTYYFPLPFFIFTTIFSYCKPLWCSSNRHPLGSLGGRRRFPGPSTTQDQVSKVFEVIETFMAFVSKDSLPFPPSAALSKRALEGDFAHCYYSSCYLLTVVICPESF